MVTLIAFVRRFGFVASTLLFFLAPSHLTGQAPTGLAQPATQDDNMAPEAFTTVLKEVWTFLKDETDSLMSAIERKREFETSAEFERRVADTRRQYVAKTIRYAQDKKLTQRTFGVLLKAKFVSYDADKEIYTVVCDTSIEAPYNIPTLVTTVPHNPYVGLADSIKGGYRTSQIYLKFRPSFQWRVGRDAARLAKNEEGELFFKVRFNVGVSQENFKKDPTLTVVPAHIMLMNKRTNTIHWEQKLM